MPRLPALTPEKVIKVLKKKGFVLDRLESSHLLPSRNQEESPVSYPGKNYIQKIFRNTDLSRTTERKLMDINLEE